MSLPAVGFAILIASAGASQVVRDFRSSSRYLGRGGETEKVVSAVSNWFGTIAHWHLLIAAFLLLALVWRSARALVVSLCILLPLLSWPSVNVGSSTSVEFVAHYGWVALPLYLVIRALVRLCC